jgi:tetratricopeptide (TPR) repeat protein
VPVTRGQPTVLATMLATVLVMLGAAESLARADARAATPSPADQAQASAREAMKRGIAAFARGDAAAALERYREAEELVPEANGPYRYAAEALLKLNRYTEAIESLEKYLELRPNVSDAGDVRALIAGIKAEHLPGKVEVTSTPAAALLYVDASTSSVGTAPAQLTLDPGEHSLRAEAVGYANAVVKIHVVGSVTTGVAMTLVPLPRPRQGLSLTAWGGVATATGSAVLVAAVIVDVAFLGPAINDFRAAARAGASNADSLESKASTLRAVAAGGYVLGAASALTGATLLIVGGRRHASSVALGVWGAGGRGGVSLQARW